MTPFQPSDADLIARTRAGDRAAFDALYRWHVDDARRVALIVSSGAAEAEGVVAEAFTRVLAQLRRGGGPGGELRPYLRTLVRRLAVDRYRSGARGGPPADPDYVASLPAPDDPIAIATNRDMMRKAYETLPPRWQEVLWRTEVEGHTPASLAERAGSTPNAVAALAYRAREGLRQAYLSMHVASSLRADCKPYVPMITALTRGTLSPGEESAVNDHIATCLDCRERRDEVLVLVSDLRNLLVPALLGVAMTTIPAVAAAGAPTVAGPSAGGGAAAIGHARPRGAGVAAVAGATAAVVAAFAVAVAMVAGVLDSPRDDAASDPPVAASAPLFESPDGAPDQSATPEGELEGDQEEEIAEPEIAPSPVQAEIASPAAINPEPAPAEPAPAETSTQEPEPQPEPEPAPAELAASRPSPGQAEEPATPEPEPVAAESRGQAPSDPPHEEPINDGNGEGPADPGDETEPPPSSSGPPWCSVIPTWPGCPEGTDGRPRDAVCLRLPDLPWCP